MTGNKEWNEKEVIFKCDLSTKLKHFLFLSKTADQMKKVDDDQAKSVK